MRTFPKQLAKFREIVEARGAQLRTVPFEKLKELGNTPVDHLTVDSRPATIGIIVQPLRNGGIRVVVQGFMKARLFGANVALDGFYKYPDETVAPMPDREIYQFD